MNTIALLFIASTTGILLEQIGLPNGVLLGAMVASWLFARRIQSPTKLQPFAVAMQIILGFSTGMLFLNWTAGVLFNALPSLLVFILCLLAQIFGAAYYLTKVSKWRRTDALMGVYPGALAAVFDLLRREDASNGVIVIHVIRLLSITLVAAAVASFYTGAPTSIAPAQDLPLLELSAMLGLCLVVGALLRRASVPAPYLLTSILATLFALKLGYIHPVMLPAWAMTGATIVLGTLIGTNVAQVSTLDLLRYGKAGAVSVIIMLAIAALFAAMMAAALSLDFVPLWMAYMPGAVETLAVLAFAGGMDVAFILSHHLVRMITLQCAPAVISWRRR